MEFGILGKTGLKVSYVGLGVLTIGPAQLNLPLDKGAEVVRYAIDSGINFIDTAEYYQTYPYIKKALKGVDKELVIVSKSLEREYDGMKQSIEKARKELDRDVIDIFLLHEVRHYKDFAKREGALECLKEAKEKGLIKFFGASSHHTDVCLDMARRDDMDVLFPLINYTGIGIRTGRGEGTREDMEFAIREAKRNNLGLFAMKALGGGVLLKDYVKALNYIRNFKEIDSLVLGCGNTKEIDTLLEWESGALSESYVPDLTYKKIKIDKSDCESCGACLKRCPNKAIFYDKDGMPEIDEELCMTCGYCAPVCPVRAIIMIG